MIQIQFLDSNIVKALVPVFSQKPARVIFLYSSKVCDEKCLKNFEAAIHNRCPEIQVEFEVADKHDFRAICDKLNEILNRFTDEEVMIEITGGTELMTTAGVLVGRERNIPVLYASTSKREVFDVMTGEVVSKISDVRLDDYLTAVGAEQNKKSHSMPLSEEYDRVCGMAEYLMGNQETWYLLHGYISKHASVTEPTLWLYADESIMSDDEYVDMLEMFCHYGFLAPGRFTGEYKFANMRYKEYLTVYGVWLEMYVYIKAKEYFDQAYLGVVIDWDNADNRRTEDNEIDVVAIRKSMVYFISCKMCKPLSTDVYEVASLANRLGGGCAKAIIATTFDVSKSRKDDTGLYYRFKKMKVGALEADEFKDKKAGQVFNHVIQQL